jgi:tetratricopeptide (TPR) repeat protein
MAKIISRVSVKKSIAPGVPAPRWHPVEVPIAWFEDVSEWDSTDACDPCAHAHALARLGDANGARRVLEAALANDANSPSLRFALGVVALRAGDRTRAFACFSRASESDADRADFALAAALAAPTPDIGRLFAERALALDPLHVAAWRIRAWAAAATSDQALAVVCLRRATELAPLHPQVLACAASLAHRLGLADRAYAWVQRACALAPDWPRLWHLRWQVLLALAGEDRSDQARQRAQEPRSAKSDGLFEDGEHLHEACRMGA